MKKQLLSITTALSCLYFSAQTQVGNNDFEQWENLGQDTEEPVNWNSFKSADGVVSGFAQQQIEQSTDTRPGSTGMYSVRIWSRQINAGLTTVVANGNFTLGRINMGGIVADNPENNYNFSQRDNADFSEAYTEKPDSVVVWVKFTAANNSSEAKMKVSFHDDNRYQDPESGNVGDYIVGRAEKFISPTGDWQRVAVAIDYSGPAQTSAFVLATFTTNKTPGGGDENDELLVDDFEFKNAEITSVFENQLSANIYTNSNQLMVNFTNTPNSIVNYELVSITGKTIQTGSLENSKNAITVESPKGMYILKLESNSEVFTQKVQF